MKSIFLFLFISSSFLMNAQSEKGEKKELKQVSKSSELTVSKELGEKEVKNTDANQKKWHAQVEATNGSQKTISKEKTVDYYDGYIAALEKKIAYVKADSEENKKAKKSGWFDEMNQNISTAKSEREKLLNK